MEIEDDIFEFTDSKADLDDASESKSDSKNAKFGLPIDIELGHSYEGATKIQHYPQKMKCKRKGASRISDFQENFPS